MKIKVFVVQTRHENAFAEIEKQVNDWLAQFHNKIAGIVIHTNSFPTVFSITIQYEPAD